jgi:hypothetical protein
MITWQEFAQADPNLALIGERLLLLKDYHDRDGTQQGKAGLGYLATVRKDGGPRVHLVSPVLDDGHLYAFILENSPKKHDLLQRGMYALHSFPHPLEKDSFKDEEFYVAGRAMRVTDMALRRRVAEACGENIDSGEIFELGLERALHKGRDKGAALYSKWIAQEK